MKRILVTPRAGLKVRDPAAPHLGHLPEVGAIKLDSTAWRRLAAAGDVTISDDPAAAVAVSAPASAKPSRAAAPKE